MRRPSPLTAVTQRNRGRWFERLLDQAHAHYAHEGRAQIRRQPTPTLPLRERIPGGRIRLIAIPVGRADVDYRGTLAGGRAIAFDAKSTATARGWSGRIPAHQLDILRAEHRLESVCGIMLAQWAPGWDQPRVIWVPMGAAEHLSVGCWTAADALGLAGAAAVPFHGWPDYLEVVTTAPTREVS